MTTNTLEFRTHVRTGTTASVSINIDKETYAFNLEPTINWVASSSAEGSHKVPVEIESLNNTKKVVKIKISVEHNDVLICGYEMPGAHFVISSQPIWNVQSWQPYDISGHEGDDSEYQGNGSLQIMAGQTVEFEATVFE